jgi:hypothetical protein
MSTEMKKSMHGSEVEVARLWNATVVPSNDHLSCDLNGEAVFLNLKTGFYYGLDPMATWIFGQIQKQRTVAEIRDAILDKYEVEFDRCERDLLSLLQELLAARLIEFIR